MTIGDTISSFSDFTGGGYTVRSPLSSYGTDKKLYMYQTVGSYYQHKIIAPINSSLYHITYGSLQSLPDSKLMIQRDYNYTLPGSSVDINLNGEISWSGYQNNGLKRSGTLIFEFMDSSEKDTVLNIFKYGKGCLPMWFIDDITDESTWMLLSLRTLRITEPYVDYFTAEISWEEF